MKLSKQSVSFSGLFDFSRSTIATYIDPVTGNREEAAINEERFNQDGLIVEYKAKNLLINSSTPATQTVTVVPGENYTLTSFGEGAGYSFLSSGGSGAAPIGSPITFEASSTSVEISVSGSLDGFQLELGVKSSSFIETAGAPVTRESDILSRTFGDEYNSEEGTFFVEYIGSHQAKLADSQPQGNVNWFLSSYSARQIIATIQGVYHCYNGSNSADYPAVMPSGDFEKIAISYKQGEWILSRNGSAIAYTSLINYDLDVTDIRFFEAAEGVLSKFEYWPTAKTAEELEALTANT